MSRTFLVAVGGLLVILGGLIGLVVLGAEHVPTSTAVPLIVIPTLLGSASLAAGLRNPYGSAYRHLIVRKADASYLWTGLALIAGSSFVLYFGLGDFLPQRLAGGVFLGVPVGVLIMAAFVGDACARCGKRLEGAHLRFPGADLPTVMQGLRAGDVPAALTVLRKPDSAGSMSSNVALDYCPACRAVAVCRANNERVVLEGEAARRLVDALAPPK